ncbi:MAG: hypothetical protein IPK14_26755 [Blastocatellia bacterium]|nr:hypothetical protein [Blastocatellia bacterium]MBL8195740.1 hypothetical protein [Blastocatellia bacterium]MBN8723543.1 hypothetical protein [Acidobacteriota bacterium]
MNPLLISTILLASLVIGLMLTWYSTKKELKTAKQKLESLNTMQPFDAKPLIDLQKRVQELEKKVLENVEKEDKEFNTLWAELENLRSEIYQQINNGITLNNWNSLLKERIPHFLELKAVLNELMIADKDLAMQFNDSLPAYLINENLIAGLLDFARLPYERINWLELVILPIDAQLALPESPNLIVAHQKLLHLIGYEAISPKTGETYRPDFHEVIEQRLSTSIRGTILATKSLGYVHQGKVLKKAKVVISAGQN